MGLETAHETDPRRVSALFDRIARRYDLLNRIMSLGGDVRWRERLVERVRAAPGPLLDLCTGTGDVALLAVERGRQGAVLGADASLGMLRRGRAKDMRGALAGWLGADGLSLPLRDGAVGAITVAFGVRNVARLDDLLRELRRVLRPGGRLAILEIFAPRGDLLGHCYDLYLRGAIPAMGTLLGGDGPAYRHLAASARSFGRPESLAARLQGAGFRGVGTQSLNLGTIGVVWGDRE